MRAIRLISIDNHGSGIRAVMEDRGAAIAVGEDMGEPAGDVETWLAGHGGKT